MSKLEAEYIELLQLAEQTQSRREAVWLIRKAERLRNQITSHLEIRAD